MELLQQVALDYLLPIVIQALAVASIAWKTGVNLFKQYQEQQADLRIIRGQISSVKETVEQTNSLSKLVLDVVQTTGQYEADRMVELFDKMKEVQADVKHGHEAEAIAEENFTQLATIIHEFRPKKHKRTRP